jgi:hypothetical protein
MNMSAKFFGGMMGMVLSLIGAVQAKAQCPTVMSVTQVASGCGADVTYAVTNTVGFQFIQFELDGTPISTQPSGTISLDPGTYTFAVSTADANNCTMYIEEEVTVVSPTGFSAFITVQATPCGGQCTGALMAGANGGTPPYTYMWSMANTTQVVDDLCEGFYTAWVTDANGCSAEASVNLAEAPPAVAFFNDTVACNGFLSIDMNTTGGTGDYSFAWTPADMMVDPTAEFPTMTVGTDTTLVSVTVTDNVTGCATTESLLVYPNVPIQATFELCNGSALLEVNPGSVMYNWSATDVDGNTIDMSGAQGQAAILALETGTYSVVTYYTGCNVTTHVFEVVACSVQCNSTINPSSTWTNCSTNFCFDAGGVPAIESYAWDFAGMYSSEAPSACFSQTLAGDYEVTLTATHVGGCVSTSVVTVQATADGMEVNLPDDDGLIACNGTLFITPVVTGGSGDFSYLWEPTAVVSNPTAQTGNITVSAPEWVYVTVTDNVTGCMAEDSVYVSPNLPVNESLTLCNGPALLELDPGSVMYTWSATDVNGNAIDMSGITGNSFEATVAGDYAVVTYYAGCNVTTHVFEVVGCANDVWPGDANSDGEATNTDALWVGLAFDQTGPIRPNATLLWEGQPAPDWNFNFAQNNVNLKHADTDGNGTVNFADTIAISQNYGQTHGKTENALGGYPMLWIEATPDTVGLSQAVNVTVRLADAAMPVDSLHGIAFTLTFESALVVQSGFSIDFSQNMLGTVGTDVLTLQQPFFANGEVDVAISRTTLQNFSGHGPLMTARIVTTDNLSGYNALHIGLSGITAITATEAEVLLATSPDTVIIDPDHVGVSDLLGPEFSIYPNPSTGIFQLEGLQGTVMVEVMDATGRRVSVQSNNGNSRMMMDMSALPGGIYLLRASNAAGVAVKRIELLGR